MDVSFSCCDLVYWAELKGLGLHELELLLDSWVTRIRPSQMLYIRHIIISTNLDLNTLSKSLSKG